MLPPVAKVVSSESGEKCADPAPFASVLYQRIFVVFFLSFILFHLFDDILYSLDHIPVNIAGWGTANQSTSLQNMHGHYALDGLSYTCTHTALQSDPWWKLDLLKSYISRVVITNRIDCCPERINGVEIRIGHSLENNGNNNPIFAVISRIPAGVSSTYICNNMEGQYVNLFIPGYSKHLTLCEVPVYGEGRKCQ
uniref:Fucolectin tachylectin-4 pentraxin-1 domain-containing protein n=1 Tax=Sinocyclocheilus grahami TaxID=75366 RepID=A0A672PIP7_SINGR